MNWLQNGTPRLLGKSTRGGMRCLGWPYSIVEGWCDKVRWGVGFCCLRRVVAEDLLCEWHQSCKHGRRSGSWDIEQDVWYSVACRMVESSPAWWAWEGFWHVVGVELLHVCSIITAALFEIESTVCEAICSVWNYLPVESTSNATGPYAGGTYGQP